MHRMNDGTSELCTYRKPFEHSSRMELDNGRFVRKPIFGLENTNFLFDFRVFFLLSPVVVLLLCQSDNTHKKEKKNQFISKYPMNNCCNSPNVINARVCGFRSILQWKSCWQKNDSHKAGEEMVAGCCALCHWTDEHRHINTWLYRSDRPRTDLFEFVANIWRSVMVSADGQPSIFIHSIQIDSNNWSAETFAGEQIILITHSLSRRLMYTPIFHNGHEHIKWIMRSILLKYVYRLSAHSCFFRFHVFCVFYWVFGFRRFWLL